ncbi:hypothetical protein D3C80_1818850 [compost metagenome]
MREQGDQIRIGGVVEADEARIDRHLARRHARRHRIGVAAQTLGLLIDRHPMALRQQPGRRQGGDARTDHGDLEIVGGRIGHYDSRTRPSAQG